MGRDYRMFSASERRVFNDCVKCLYQSGVKDQQQSVISLITETDSDETVNTIVTDLGDDFKNVQYGDIWLRYYENFKSINKHFFSSRPSLMGSNSSSICTR